MADVPFPYVSTANAIGHTALQFAAGSAVGIAVDVATEYIFNAAGLDDQSIDAQVSKNGPLLADGLELMAVLARVSVQVLITGVAIGAAMNMLAALSTESADPSGGAVFAIVLFRSQRNLGREVDRLLAYVSRWMLRIGLFAEAEVDRLTSTAPTVKAGAVVRPGTARTHTAGVALSAGGAEERMLRRKGGIILNASQM
jgi:hypothetical protein